MADQTIVEIKAPSFPESISEGTLTVWHVETGANVRRDDVLADIETDKVTIEVVAPDNGALVEQVLPEGAIVTSEQLIGRFQEGVAVATDDTAATATETSAPEDTAVSSRPAIASPAAKKLALEAGLDLARVAGSGRDGRITKDDVQNAIAAQAAAASAAQSATATEAASAGRLMTGAAPEELDPGERAERRVPMTRLRASIARRLVEAQQTAAMLTTFNEVDMSAIMALRKEYQDEFTKAHDGTRLGFMSFFVRASVEALKRFPAVNASIDGSDIVYHGYYDVGVAVGTERGLVVPVIRDADGLSLAQLERSIGDFGEKARNNKLTLEELSGGTFTISNGGVFGSLLSTPILNPPQTGILGMHKIEQRPMAVNGEVVIRPMMYLALSYDHRLIDGSEAVRFLVTIRELLEQPARILLDI